MPARASLVRHLAFGSVAAAVLLALSSSAALAQATGGVPGLAGICEQTVNTAQNATWIQRGGAPINSVLQALDGISSSIFTQSGEIGLSLAAMLGTIETVWFVLLTVVWKQRIEDMFKDMIFKSLAYLTVISLIIGLSGASAPGFGSANIAGGAIVKEFSFGLFAQLAQKATSGLVPPTATIDPSTPASSLISASNGILSDSLQAADAVLSCPAAIYNTKHTIKNSNLLAGILNVSFFLQALPDETTAWLLAIGIVIMYALLDVLLVVTMVDGLIVLAVGVFTVGFGNARWTSDNAASYFKLMFSVGWKVFSYVFIANLGVIFINRTIVSEMTIAQTFGLDYPALPPGGAFALVIVLLLIGLMAIEANSISRALSNGTFSIGIGATTAARALELAYIAYAVGSGGAAAAAGRNGIAAAGRGAAGAGGADASGGAGFAGRGASNGSAPRQIPSLPLSIKNYVQGGIEHETTGVGISFRPHGN